MSKLVEYKNLRWWKGPYDCLIPESIKSCPAEDGHNYRTITGSETELYVGNPYTREKWIEEFADIDENGNLIYKHEVSSDVPITSENEDLSLLNRIKETQSNNTYNIIVYHKGCADGIMAVWIALKHINAQYIIPCDAGAMPDFSSIRGSRDQYTVYFLDICPTTIDNLLGFKKIVICDHHLPGIEFFNSIEKPENFELLLDIERSGCQISFDYFETMFKNPLEVFEITPDRFWIIDYVADRDLHKFKLPFSAEINLAFFKKSLHYQIELYFLNFKKPLDLSLETFESNLQIGKLLLDIQNNEIEIACKTAILRNIYLNKKKYLVWISLFQMNPSEVGARLARTPARDGSLPDFACICTYNLRKEMWKISVRGRDDGPDLNQICGEMGGGGHHSAAKFELSYQEFDRIFNINKYLDRKKDNSRENNGGRKGMNNGERKIMKK